MTLAFERLTAAVSEFHNWVELPRHRHLSPKVMYEFNNESLWSDQYNVDPSLPGCYIFEDVKGDLYYVGSVSANEEFGRRFASYVRQNPADKTKTEKLGNAIDAKTIYVIDVAKEYAFIAPALEQFLISYLNPRCNLKDSVRALRATLVSEGLIVETV